MSALRAGFKCVEAPGRIIMLSEICLQCFDAVGWAAGKAEWWGAGVVVCLEQGADNSMIYTVSQKNTILPSVTSLNVNRFSKFFQC